MQRATLCAVAVVLALCNIVLGQSWQQTKGLGLGLSAVKFIGDITDRAAIGDLSSLSIKYGPTYYMLIELQAGYGSFKPSVLGSKYKKDSADPHRTFLFPLDIAIKLTAARTSPFKPYLTLGGGVLFWDLRYIDDPDVSFWGDHQMRWGSRISGLRKNIALHEGLGLEIFPIPSISIDLQGRFTSLLQMRIDNVGQNDINSQILQASATLNYYFGFYQDRDRDGIPDKLDKDPKNPEDKDGFQDEDGVPDPDNDLDRIPDNIDKAPLQPEDEDGYLDEDGVPDLDNDEDGILDVDDQCMFEPEDKDGFQDEDGCPDIDNDQDGIVDPLDACPNEPEDLDGFEDQNGCPDPDNDKDGIPDVVDKCPNQPETFNGYLDEDGCPDEIMELKSKPEAAGMDVHFDSTGVKLTLPGITFKSGSTLLTPESSKTLALVIKALKEQPQAMIEIRGFTDNVGNDDRNQKLSEQRAMAVLKYLVKRSISTKRLRAMGFGELDPVAGNDTAEGRAQNRRIEFLRVK